MAHPQSSTKKTAFPRLAELLTVPKSYRLLERTSFEAPEPNGGGILLHICRHCGLANTFHTGPQNNCPPRFVLVDESTKREGEIVRHTPHTADELVLLIGEAYPEVSKLLRRMGEAEQAAVTVNEIMGKIFDRLMDGKREDFTLSQIPEVAEARITKLMQARDVLQNIAYREAATADQLRFIARRYIEGFIPPKIEDPSKSNVIPLVDEKNGPSIADGTPLGDTGD